MRASGFHGVEASLDDIGATAAERRDCVLAAQAEGVSLILSAYSSWPNYVGTFDAARSVAQHVSAMAGELRQIAELHTSLHAGLSPVLRVNAHSGSDAWSEAEAVDYFEGVSREVGAITEGGGASALPAVSHETHRGRYLCCPFATARDPQRDLEPRPRPRPRRGRESEPVLPVWNGACARAVDRAAARLTA